MAVVKTTASQQYWRIRHTRKDVGVLLVSALALVAGFIIHRVVDARLEVYQEPESTFRLAYPSGWEKGTTLSDSLLKVQDPETGSAYKSNVVVIRRDLDIASPPTLQTLLDRRVEERNKLTGYHFLGSRETTVGGTKGVELGYAFTTQPIDQPRSASLPVVVQTRDVILVGRQTSYYVTLSAPSSEYDRANAQFDEMLKTVRVE